VTDQTYRKTVLPNGLRVLTEAMPSFRSATIGIWADVGSASETHARRGISHLVEHMLFKGTQRRSAREIAETMDGVGGNLNAFTDKETTCYYAKVIDRHVPLALDVLADMFLNSVFDPSELAKEQKVVLEEIKMYEDSPDESIHDLFLQTMWSGSNLGAPTIGFAETIGAITPDDLRAHMKARYAPDSVIVAASGNIDHDGFVEAVARQFAAFTGSSAPVPPETGVRGRRRSGLVGARRAALRAFAARHDPGRWDVEPALSRDSRETRPGLHGLLVPGSVQGGGAVRRLCRNVAGERAGLHRRHRRAVSRDSRYEHRARRAAAREGTHQG
jgi:predicted Zn-dependent peptidase